MTNTVKFTLWIIAIGLVAGYALRYAFSLVNQPNDLKLIGGIAMLFVMVIALYAAISILVRTYLPR